MGFENYSGDEPATEPREFPDTLGFAEAVTAERTLLDRFQDKARRVAEVLLIATSLSIGAGAISEADAGEQPGRGGTEQGAQGEEERNVKTAEDAEWYSRKHVNQLATEFYFPTGSGVEVGPYGTSIKRWSKEEVASLIERAGQLSKTIWRFHKKFRLVNYNEYQSRLREVVSGVRGQSSYSREAQLDELNRIERLLQERQQ